MTLKKNKFGPMPPTPPPSLRIPETKSRNNSSGPGKAKKKTGNGDHMQS